MGKIGKRAESAAFGPIFAHHTHNTMPDAPLFKTGALSALFCRARSRPACRIPFFSDKPARIFGLALVSHTTRLTAWILLYISGIAEKIRFDR
ncbi:MAG: hypothetical protein LBQ63_03080, partial [Deltaproteobacteria bacterium]|nr:hypothetical protein [Deltaproteobacteria bacterium]